MANKHTGLNTEVSKEGLAVKVQYENVDRAMGKLRRLMQTERWVSDVRAKDHFVSKGEKKRKAAAEARRRNLKALRTEDEDLSHDQMHRQSALKRGRTRKQRRERDRQITIAHLEEKRLAAEEKAIGVTVK